MTTGPKVLIVDDEPQIRRFLRASLQAHDYQVIEAENGKEDQEPAPKGCSTYALTDRCSDPHTQQRGNDRKCGQGNISEMEGSTTSQARRKRNC